jgi:hypothetical protein
MNAIANMHTTALNSCAYPTALLSMTLVIGTAFAGALVLLYILNRFE